MKKTFGKWFGLDVPLEEVYFNIAVAYLSIIFILMIMSGIYFGFERNFYYVIGLAGFVTAFCIGYVTQSHNYQRGTFAIAMILEVFYFPVSYIMEGRLLSFVIIYYFISVLIVIFVLRGRLRNMAFAIYCFSWAGSVLCVYEAQYKASGFNLSDVDYAVDIIIPFFIVGLFLCSEIYAQIKHYEHESRMAEDSREEADYLEKQKEVFLMNMSHEIRTPMNAIMSAAELMEAQVTDSETEQNIQYIMNACKALVAIVDDLLVISKQDDRRIVLAENSYDVKEFLTEIINMIAVRLMGTGVEFYVYIDPLLPRGLYGDAMRVRQVFINILNNAVKYTRTGHIFLKVGMKDITADMITLHVEVEDTGIGIKEDKLSGLFEDYLRVADDINQSLRAEGTGLGLPISKAIIDACDGNISVDSVYNKGSVFSFDIPQKVSDMESIADVGNRDGIKIMIYDEDAMFTDILCMTLRDLKLFYETAHNRREFKEMVFTGSFTHIFISLTLFPDLQNIDLPEGIRVFIMRKYGDEDYSAISDFPKLTKPLSAISLDRALTDFEPRDTQEKGRHTESDIDEEDHTVINARALVVDDNPTNLIVAERLLRREGFDVVTADSGNMALDLVSAMRFDILFIDYMMTGMDGVDTLRAIRRLPFDWAVSVPCIVLTADAHDGAKQMLINAGFDDYLPKPINISELEYMIKQYITPTGHGDTGDD